MTKRVTVREGMQVLGSDKQAIGVVERVAGDTMVVAGQSISMKLIARVDQQRVYLSQTASALRSASSATQDETGELRVPVTEERLNVSKREVSGGEVEIRKTVTEEQVSVPVELSHEEVRLERVDVPERRASAAEIASAFTEETLRVPTRSEEAVVSKQAVVTGEVVVNKDRTTERQDVAETVRREHVEVDEHYAKSRPAYAEHFTQTNRAKAVAGKTRTFEEAERNYQQGYRAARDPQHAGRTFEEVEPGLRREVEAQPTTDSATDAWEHLRDEVRAGFTHAARS